MSELQDEYPGRTGIDNGPGTTPNGPALVNPMHEARAWVARWEKGERAPLTDAQCFDLLKATFRVIEAQRHSIEEQQKVIGSLLHSREPLLALVPKDGRFGSGLYES
jgi:hypothetical protein